MDRSNRETDSREDRHEIERERKGIVGLTYVLLGLSTIVGILAMTGIIGPAVRGDMRIFYVQLWMLQFVTIAVVNKLAIRTYAGRRDPGREA